MDNEGKITSEQLKQLIKENEPFNMKTIDWRGMPLTVRTFIPLKEVIDFTNNVRDNCFDEKSNRFVLEMVDFAFRVNVVLRYSCAELPKETEAQYYILYNTDLFDTIAEAINSTQLKSIYETIKRYMKM